MINLAKIGLFGLYINYYPYNIMFGHFIPYGTQIFFALIVVGVFGDFLNSRQVLDKEIKYWIVYGLLALVTSIFARSPSFAVSSLSKYATLLIFTFAVAYVCERENSIYFAIKLLSVVGILSALAGFVQMGDITKRLSLESGASISTNDFGSIMAFSAFAVIPFFRYSRFGSETLRGFLSVGCSGLLIMEIFLSGSRKSFYAVLLLYGMLFLFVWLKNSNAISTNKFLGIAIAVIIVGFIAWKYLLPNLDQTSLFMRIWGRKAEAAAASDGGRLELYANAWEKFIENPLFGLGYNNYIYVYSSYSHSAYAEPLACTGLLSIIYFAPLIRIFKRQFALAKYKGFLDSGDSFQTELMIFYLVFLFVGIGIPYIYKEIPCIIFGMFIANHRIEYGY